jgi:hypothetical protein
MCSTSSGVGTESIEMKDQQNGSTIIKRRVWDRVSQTIEKTT